MRSDSVRILAATAAVMLCAAVGCSPSVPSSTPPSPVEPQRPVPTPAPVPAPRPSDTGLDAAQAWLAGVVTGHDGLDIAFEGDPVDLTPPAIIDIGYGNGHGGTLGFVRLSVGAETTHCERVAWKAYRRAPTDIAGEASRAEVPTATLRPLLDGVRALSRAVVTQRPRDWPLRSSLDVFVLVRVCRTDPAADRTWEFGGYAGNSHAVSYAAPQAVVEMAKQHFMSMTWTPVPSDALRTTHFPDSFNRNRALLGEPYHWWVIEFSLDALGWFGDRTTLPTVTWIRDNVGDRVGRQSAKIRHILDEPDTYLSGPPREVPEK